MLRFVLAAAVASLSPAGAAAAGGNAERGEELYSRCTACHAVEYHRVGPRHCDLLGRRAGAAPGFTYSEAMKNSRLVWNEKTLDRFLANPLKVAPGTTMTYAGVPEAKDRADLIAYLSSVRCKGG